ncbi:hypothetical protein A3H15_00580 [Candidatus Kaiserbacteria bacterium RIFCSPLOWO2_12_FULL_50_28]|uniref:Uncharacterized protein n=1 Tax=Candidatus Kaiserbacteria bacterium RIFCSPLOWO2_12_FULL_50_28 TaxID=1798527 RepID=A0A1F6FPR8_9BACT|nr:MAG: hypothetical protein A3H15_00580 [Candidatus Kaiserbacteria bacterium RIFCSPLOWO2_12_FULL_50_28]
MTVGGGAATVTVALRAVLPPAPVQVRVYVRVEVTAPVLSLPPLADFAPLQAFDAVQLVAPDTLHESVEAALYAMDAGFAARVTVGGGYAVIVNERTAPYALPPAFSAMAQ